MRSARAGLVAFLALGTVLLSGPAAAVSGQPSKAVHRPRYIFINETDNHEHDLALKMSLKLAEQRAGIENALVLLKQLPRSSTIEQLAEETFRHWQIGRDRGGRGILYLYSERENLFKIEVSYSLEGLFPDAVCRQLEEAARTYMLSEIPQDFLSELLITMNLRAKDPNAEPGGSMRRPTWMKGASLSGGGGVTAPGYRNTLEDYEAVVRRMPAEDYKQFEPAEQPEETVVRYLKSLEEGLGDPRLPLLTEGSQVFRVVVPRNEAQQQRVSRYYQSAEPWQLIRREPFSLVVFHTGVANLPILLRHGTDGLWYVDEPKAWTYFHRFENAVDFYPKYSDLPFLDALTRLGYVNAYQPVYGSRVGIPAARPYPFSLKSAVAELEKRIAENPNDDRLCAELGGLYLFEMNWISRSLEMFERAAKLAPSNLEYHWRLWDLYGNDSQMEKALAQLKLLSERSPADRQVQQWYRYYKAEYSFKPGDFFR